MDEACDGVGACSCFTRVTMRLVAGLAASLYIYTAIVCYIVRMRI